jgi:hypothetical protein
MADIKKTTPTVKATPPKTPAQPEKKMVFERENYILFFVGIAFIVIGYIIMAGGHTNDPNQFHPDEIFAWRRINLAPTLVLMGFGIEIVAIMYRKKKTQ